MGNFSKEKRNTFNVLFIIKKAKLLKNGEAPICMRITINCEVAEILIKRSITPALWNQPKECSKGKNRSDMELNHYIESMRTKVHRIHREMEIDGIPVTASTLKDRVLGKHVESVKGLIEIYAEHNDRCEKLIGKDFTRSTVDKFKTSISHLKEFLGKQYGKKEIPLTEVNGEFIRNFDFFLKTEKDCCQNSTIKHLKNLKKIVRIALANEWMKKDPFFGFQFKQEEVHVEFLTQEEVNILIEKEFPIHRLQQIKDIFLFCCFTGLAFKDVQLLKAEHLVNGVQGEMWIRKARQKTHKMSNVPLLSIPIQIIEKYKNHPDCIKKEVVLPVPSNQKMNSYLKEIADLCGINKNLSTHCARHTFATMTLANSVSLASVSKMLGHSSVKMTQHYARVLDQTVAAEMSEFQGKFSKAI